MALGNFMKKEYTSPKLIPIGDMVNNTLGSSGTVADNGTRQAGGNGTQGSSGQTTSNQKTIGLDSDGFSNDGFSQ